MSLRSLIPFLFLAPAASAGNVIYVDANLASGANDGSSWANAYQGIDGLQAALATTVSGDQVFVAEGTYRPTATSTRTIRFLLQTGVEIYGGFLGTEDTPAERPPFGTAPSVLTGDLNGDDDMGMIGENSYHILGGNGADSTAVIDGFVVRGGNANTGTGNNSRGAGILTQNNETATIRKCHFIDNRCTFGGAAGYINGAAPTFTDCIFENGIGGSFGGAFDIATAGAVRFERCLFKNNTAARAGALEVFATNGVVVSNCVFEGNVSTGTGGGGAIWLGQGGNTQIRGCTVVGNSATNQLVGGIRVQTSAGSTISNTIVWNNSGPGGSMTVDNQINAAANVTYSLVQGGFGGLGNVAGDPMFEDQAGGDYRLTAASPAVDAGANGNVPAGVTLDFGLSPRFVDEPTVADTGAGVAPIVDMGANERQAGLGMNYCNVNVFSTGASTVSATGSASISANDLVLTADNLPIHPGVFIAGPTQAQVPLFSGFLCIDPQGLQRFNAVNVPLGNTITEAVDIASSAAGGLNVTAGQSYNYQRWNRDPSGGPSTANFSNGLEIVYQP